MSMERYSRVQRGCHTSKHSPVPNGRIIPQLYITHHRCVGSNKGVAAQLRALPLERLQCLVCRNCKI